MMILAEKVSKSFGNKEALSEVSFHINQGEIIGFLGQNGAGKTTLMRVMTTYLFPSSGKMFIAGENTFLYDTLRFRRLQKHSMNS